MSEKEGTSEQNEGPAERKVLRIDSVKDIADRVTQSALDLEDIPHRVAARVMLEPTVLPELEAEIRQFKTAFRQIGQEETTYPYRLLTTRRLDMDRERTWARYVAGVKLLNTDPYVADYRLQIQEVLSGEEREAEALTGYNLEEVLEAMNIPVQKAGDLFLEQVRTALRQWTQVSLPMNEPLRFDDDIWGAEEVLKKDIAESIERVAETDPQLLSETEKMEPLQKGILADIDQVVHFLERLLEQARQYAVDLVAMLEHYLAIARRLAREARAERQLTTNEQAIDRALNKLDSQEVIERLSTIPVYMHHGEDEEGAALGTVAIPKFQEQTLNNGYQWFWVQLIQTAREQGLVPANTPRVGQS